MKTQVLVLSIAILFADVQHNFSFLASEKTSAKASSAQNAEFDFLRVHRQGKLGVTATWSLTDINGVESFSIQRTYQDPTDPFSIWEEAGTVACDLSRSFKYTDTNITPGQIYYKVVALKSDGSTFTSEIADVKILSH